MVSGFISSEKEYIFEKMDYVALGHWHGFSSVGKHENVYYSGSPERISLNDKRNSKGFVQINLDDNSKTASLFGSTDIEFKEIKIRPIVQKEIDCEDYENSLESVDATDTKDAIVEVKLKNITPMQSIDIQNSQTQRAIFRCHECEHKKRVKTNKTPLRV